MAEIKNAVAQKTGKKFDDLPKGVQLAAGIGLLLLITLAGLGIFLLFDLLLLDIDPIGKLFSALFGK